MNQRRLGASHGPAFSRFAACGLLVVLPLVAFATEGPSAGRKPPTSKAAASLEARIRVLASEPCTTVWPNLPGIVTAPPERTVLVPGQRLALGVVATGEGREELLLGTTFSFRIRLGGNVTEVPPQRPAAVRALRATGAHYAMSALAAVGVTLTAVEPVTAPASLAVVLPSWTAPDVVQRTAVVVEGEARLADGRVVPLAKAELPVDTWAAAAAAVTLRLEDSQAWMESYALRPEPQLLAPVLRLVAAANAHPLVVSGFPSYALQEAPPAAVGAFVAALAKDDEQTRALGALALQWAGKDASPILATLSPEWTTRVAAFPLPDSHKLEVTFATLDAVTKKMDLLWSEFMATGRPEPLRVIVDLLRYRGDYSAFQKLRAATVKEPTDEAARGLIYMTAGWSLGSFVRGEGLAAEYVARWREDPHVPAPLREELRNLMTNEAFRQQAK